MATSQWFNYLPKGHVRLPRQQNHVSEYGPRILSFLSMLLQVHSPTQMGLEMVLGRAWQWHQIAQNTSREMSFSTLFQLLQEEIFSLGPLCMCIFNIFLPRLLISLFNREMASHRLKPQRAMACSCDFIGMLYSLCLYFTFLSN